MLHQALPPDQLARRNPAEVAYSTNDSVRQALEQIGRTEDAQFSPSGRRIALAGFGQQRILVLEATIELAATAATVAFDRFLEIESDAFSRPHGLCWLDEQTLVVANRCGDVGIYSVPEGTGLSTIKLEPLRTLGSAEFVSSPGSVAVATIAPGVAELLVCNNYVHTVSRHLLDCHANYAPVSSEILLKRDLEVPDGVAQSASGRWIAVSNHNRHSVYLYRNNGAVNRASKPDGVLRGFVYPHGIRFSPDETALIAADAGRPFIHIFRSGDGEWYGEHDPHDTIRAISDEDFERGHYNRQEGGPKGIDLTQDGSLLIASCEMQPLAIFDIRAIVGGTGKPGTELEARRTREALFRYGARSKAPLTDAARVMVSDSQNWAHLLLIRGVWKLTSPLWAVLNKVRKKRSA